MYFYTKSFCFYWIICHFSCDFSIGVLSWRHASDTFMGEAIGATADHTHTDLLTCGRVLVILLENVSFFV